MGTPLVQEVLLRRTAQAQVDLPLASEGTLRYVFESRFGDMLIEVRDGKAFVNGEVVETADLSNHTGGTERALNNGR